MAKTLFVTPDFTSGTTQCRTLRTPNNAEWLGVFNKALLLMLNPYNWEQINETDVSVDDTIALVTAILDEFWASEFCPETAGCALPDLGSPPFRLGVNGRFEMLDPATGEWGEPTGEYEIPPTPEREEATAIERRCAAAANAAHVMELLYEAITDEIALGGDTLQVAAAMVAALVTAVGGWIAAPVYAIIQLTIALFAGMIELLQALGADVWTEGFTEKLKCALFDCSTDDGDVVSFTLDCIRENLAVEPDIFNPTIFYEYQLFAQVLYLMEVITMDGLNAAGATTDVATPDCDACGGWCRQMLSSDGTEFIDIVIGTVTAEDWILADSLVGAQRMARFSIDLGADAQLNSVYVRIVDNGGFPRVTLMHNATAWDGTNEIATWIAGAEPFHTFTGFTPISGGYLGIQINANDPAQTVMNDLILSSDILGAENPFGEDNC